MPLVRGDGSLFGTLCAIDPSPQPDQIANQQPTIELLARMLSTILEADLKAISEARCAERARFEALVDPLTELWNRRAWEQLMAAEEARCHRYGHPACVVSIDLDGFKKVNDTKGHLWGDELLRKTARALRAATRNHDVVARLGGDEFSVLAVECDDACSLLLLQRLEKALEAEKVKASLGLAHRNPSFGLEHSWHEADQAMYQKEPQEVSHEVLIAISFPLPQTPVSGPPPHSHEVATLVDFNQLASLLTPIFQEAAGPPPE
jgi:diguanylate cyclase (GGDEF)-like protein